VLFSCDHLPHVGFRACIRRSRSLRALACRGWRFFSARTAGKRDHGETPIVAHGELIERWVELFNTGDAVRGRDAARLCTCVVQRRRAVVAHLLRLSGVMAAMRDPPRSDLL
jgi:hypothetical protein